MSNTESLQLFEDQPIRTAWDADAEEWYFSIVDVVGVLTEQPDARHASTYWAVLKKRLNEEGASELLTNCKQLKLKASDGKRRATDVANTEQLLRIIQSIPSKKAEPFKLWLHGSLKENLIPDLYPLHTLFFVLIEIEAQHITGIQVPVIEIFFDLLLPIRVIPWPPPYLQLDDVLLSEIIDYDVHPGLIAGLGFNIVVPCSVNDRLQIQEKLFSSSSERKRLYSMISKMRFAICTVL